MLIIGESLNATRRDVRTAIIERNETFIKSLATEQVQCGAMMLDVNAAVTGREEAVDLVWMVNVVQDVVDVPLVLDSSDPQTLDNAIRAHRGRPMINSLSAEKDKLKLIPIITQAECDVIVLCMDDSGISNDVYKRVDAARIAVEALLSAGKKPNEIYIDPLVMAMSVDSTSPATTLKVLSLLKRNDAELSGVKTTGGLSNVSYGMPNRGLINRVFLTMAIEKGLDSCIVDVRNKALMSGIYTALALLSNKGFKDYLKLSRKGVIVG